MSSESALAETGFDVTLDELADFLEKNPDWSPILREPEGDVVGVNTPGGMFCSIRMVELILSAKPFWKRKGK